MAAQIELVPKFAVAHGPVDSTHFLIEPKRDSVSRVRGQEENLDHYCRLPSMTDASLNPVRRLQPTLLSRVPAAPLSRSRCPWSSLPTRSGAIASAPHAQCARLRKLRYLQHRSFRIGSGLEPSAQLAGAAVTPSVKPCAWASSAKPCWPQPRRTSKVRPA